VLKRFDAITDETAAVIALLRTRTNTEPLIQAIERLRKGAENKWNPYWTNSSKKLNAIVSAINTICTNNDEKNAIEEAIADPTSDLYQAVNMKRLLTESSFFGKVAYKETKSLIIVHSENSGKTNLP